MDGLTTWAKIELDAVEHNLQQVKNKLEANSDIIAVVKANAYGHGAVKIAQKVIEVGVDMLAVATVEEGIELRQEGINESILVLGTLLEEQIQEVIKYNLTPVMYTLNFAKKAAKITQQLGQKITVHVAVDTGMGRIGILAANRPAAKIKAIASLRSLNVEGVFTHFAVADEDRAYTKEQLKIFNGILDNLKAEGIEIPMIHAANSAAVINFPEAHYNRVRLGIALYGLPPAPDLAQELDLKPVLSWKAHVVHVKTVTANTNISYGCTYITDTETKVATLAVGYYDGYDRRLSNQAEVLINGQRAPVIGRVCMDQIMVDVSNMEVKKGDVATLIGQDGEEKITAQELADQIGTINYEVVSRIGPRVKRIFYV
ncbi:MAG: alanine racemase [Bacillota bacterium]